MPSSSTTSPVTFNASANSFGRLRLMELWVDGNKGADQYHAWGPRAWFDLTGSTIASGTHRGVIFAADIDNHLQKTQFDFTVGGGTACSAPTSLGVNICMPASGSTVNSPVQVTATATVTGTLASTQLWVDGVRKYSTASASLNTSISLPAGSHRFAVLALNTAGQKWENAVNATVSGGGTCTAPTSDGVTICSPASGSTVSSPVQVTAAATANSYFAHMELWVDGVKKYSTTSNPLNTSVALPAGSHRFAVIAIYSDGNHPESVVNATVK